MKSTSLKYAGLTLVEVIVAVIIIALALVSILGMMRVAIEQTEQARKTSLAINLAREGMEQIYTIRNTNRLRRAGKKDESRLCVNPTLLGTTSCNAWMQSGVSYIILYTGVNGSIYPYLSGVAGALDLNDANSDSVFSLSYGTGIGNIFGRPMRYHSGSLSTPIPEGSFYREIRGLGLYQKDVDSVGGSPITCTNGTGIYAKYTFAGAPAGNSNCNDVTPKEFRFCSKVEYGKNRNAKVELCGIITNYKK